jgi:hypothetical protein
MLSSQNIAALSKALSIAQGKLGDAAKSSFNPGFKSKYADLAEVLQTIRPIASAEGLSFVQGVSYTDGFAQVTTRLMHSSGEYIEDQLCIPVTKKDAQGLGSALTYGRRYSIAAMFGIAQDDDDGNSAVSKAKTEPKALGDRGRQAPHSESNEAPPEVATDGSLKVLILQFDTGTKEDQEALTKAYNKLTPGEQVKVLPAAKAYRARIG